MKICALPVLVAFQLVFMAGCALADESQIVDLSAPDNAGPAVVLNGNDAAGAFDFSGGVGSGPDLSGNGSMVQIVQPIAATNNGAASNGQINYRYIPSPPAGSGH